MHQTCFCLLTRIISFFLILNLFTIQGCTSGVTSSTNPSVTIAAVGDVSGFNIAVTKQNQDDPLQGVRHLIDRQDIYIFNHEGIILSENSSSIMCMTWPRQSLLLSDLEISDFLHVTKVPIATLANNHVFDCGNLGIRDTILELSNRGIKSQGAGENSSQACQPLYFSVNGIKLVLVSYLAMDVDWFYAGTDRPGVAGWEQCLGKDQITALAATEDVVIVALHLHLGEGWTHYQLQENIAIIKQILEAGADIVLAHGPHVPQGVLVQDGKLALLSLGNFLFNPDTYMPKQAHDSILAKITIYNDRFNLEILPLRLDESGRPVIASIGEASKILHQFDNLSSLVGTNLRVSQGQATLTIFR